MPEDIITSVAQGTGFRSFPEYRILRALMRQDFRFFNNDTGFVANILHCEASWTRPSNLLLPEILFYLIGRRKIQGDNGQMGYVAMTRATSELEAMGFVRSDIDQACLFALTKELIEVDTSSLTEIRPTDCIKATAAGWAHMRLLSSRIEYLASILPTTALNDERFGARIYDLMQIENRTGHPSHYRYIAVVDELLVYLRAQHQELLVHPGYADLKQSGGLYIIGKVEEALSFARRERVQGATQLDLLDG